MQPIPQSFHKGINANTYRPHKYQIICNILSDLHQFSTLPSSPLTSSSHTSNLRRIRKTPLMPKRFISLPTTLIRRIAIIIHLNIPLMMCRWCPIRQSALGLVTKWLIATIEERKSRLPGRTRLAALTPPTTATRLAGATANRQNPEEGSADGESDGEPVQSHHARAQRESDVVGLEGCVEGADNGGEDGG